MSVLPYGLPEDFFVLISKIKTSRIYYMNVFDLLNKNEKRICAQILKGLSLSQVAHIYRCTTDEVNNVRLQIIAKFEQASPVKSPETRSFKI